MEGLDVQEIKELSNVELKSEIPQFVLNEVNEYAPSMEIQAEEIKDIFNEIPELRYENWKELGADQRTEVLNSFEKRIAEIEMRDAMPVEHEATRPTLFGYYNGEKLVISDNLIGNDSYEAYKETLNTLFHEGRHAYQYYNLDVKRTEASWEMVNAWQVNLKELGYESAKSSLFSNRGYYRYYTQPIEVDARTFAETVIGKLGV